MASKEGIVIVIDIGESVSKEICENNSTFLELSKKCCERIIERKLFSAPKDEIALVILGTEETDNNLDYENISVGYPLCMPNWQMLKVLRGIEGTNVHRVDWIDALVVAMDILQSNSEVKKYTTKKIVLLTNMDSEINDDKLEVIINGIKKLEVELTAIGVDLFAEDEIKEEREDSDYNETGTKNGNLISKQKHSEHVLKYIIKQTDGMACTFSEALPQLMFHQSKSLRLAPWNVKLEIGPDIKIPVSGYKKISDIPIPPWKTGSSAHNNINTEIERKYLREDQTHVDKKNLIPGYYFGSSLVPFNECDIETLSYNSGERCLTVLQFAKLKDLPRHLLIGDGVYYFVSQKNVPEADSALSSLIHTLYSEKKVAIVKKVYNKGNTPNLAALFPVIKKKFHCLMLIEIPYSEEVNEFVFPKVVPEKEKASEEELEVIDDFIDSMDLLNAEKDGEIYEAFHPKRIISPEIAHLFHCLSHRALHPDDPLPPITDDIKEVLKCPFHSQYKYKRALEALTNNFELTPVEPKHGSKKKLKTEDGDVKTDIADRTEITDTDINLEELTKNSINEIGTNKPHEDFLQLLSQGISSEEVCSQMKNVILKLILRSMGSDNFAKAQLALKILRNHCVKDNPSIYNEWLPELKINIYEREKKSFWELVTEGELGLISAEEDKRSTVTKEQAEALLKSSEDPLTYTKEDNNALDVDELFDEM